MKLKITQDFAYAHRGYDRREYVSGDVVDSDDAEMIDVATREGWAVPADKPDGKAKKAAPENKAKG